MTTPLQQAAQALIARWDSVHWKDQPHTAEYIAELREALDAEIAQAVEPVARVESIMANGRPFISRLPGARLSEGDALYLHPPQQAVTSSERADLIADLYRIADEGMADYANTGYPDSNAIKKAADMLEADAQQAAEPYDQQAMDLCNVCGWKGIFPGEPCLVCNMKLDAQQAKQVPMSDVEIYIVSKKFKATFEFVPSREVIAFARTIEAHHDISPK